jgi:hypothetical protein
VVELVDTLVLGTSAERRNSSSLFASTIQKLKETISSANRLEREFAAAMNAKAFSAARRAGCAT